MDAVVAARGVAHVEIFHFEGGLTSDGAETQ